MFSHPRAIAFKEFLMREENIDEEEAQKRMWGMLPWGMFKVDESYYLRACANPIVVEEAIDIFWSEESYRYHQRMRDLFTTMRESDEYYLPCDRAKAVKATSSTQEALEWLRSQKNG